MVNDLVIIRLNSIPNQPTLEELENYKKLELERIATNQTNLFFQDHNLWNYFD